MYLIKWEPKFEDFKYCLEVNWLEKINHEKITCPNDGKWIQPMDYREKYVYRTGKDIYVKRKKLNKTIQKCLTFIMLKMKTMKVIQTGLKFLIIDLQ